MATVCAKCGSSLEGRPRFCTTCGAPVEALSPEELKPRFCTQCGAPNEIHAQFCAKCGKPVGADAPAKAPQPDGPAPLALARPGWQALPTAPPPSPLKSHTGRNILLALLLIVVLCGVAVVGGVLVGIIENLAGTFIPYVGRELKLTIALILIVAVLMVRPSGIFGRQVVTRV